MFFLLLIVVGVTVAEVTVTTDVVTVPVVGRVVIDVVTVAEVTIAGRVVTVPVVTVPVVGGVVIDVVLDKLGFQILNSQNCGSIIKWGSYDDSRKVEIATIPNTAADSGPQNTSRNIAPYAKVI